MPLYRVTGAAEIVGFGYVNVGYLDEGKPIEIDLRFVSAATEDAAAAAALHRTAKQRRVAPEFVHWDRWVEPDGPTVREEPADQVLRHLGARTLPGFEHLIYPDGRRRRQIRAYRHDQSIRRRRRRSVPVLPALLRPVR